MTVLPILGVAAAVLATINGDSKTAPLQALTIAAASGISIYLFFSGLGRAVLAPNHPLWQLSGIEPASASRLSRQISLFALGSAVAGDRHRPAKPIAFAAEASGGNRFRGIVPGDRHLSCRFFLRLWRAVSVEREPSTENTISDGSAIPAACQNRRLSVTPGAICAFWPAAVLSSGAWRFAGGLSQFLDLCRPSCLWRRVAVAAMLFLVREVARELLNMAMECEQGTGRRGPATTGAVTEGRRRGGLDRSCPDRYRADSDLAGPCCCR